MMCVDFFSQNSNNKDKCKLLYQIPQDKLLAWELESASEYSPGPVKNEEFLYRQILSPVHYDEEAKAFKPTAFDDASNKGMSVNRLEYTSIEHINQMANDRVEQHNQSYPEKPRSFPGTVRFVCDDIRKITVHPDGSVAPVRGCVVYDTAYEHDQSHADICEIAKTKAYARSVRLSILDLANNFLQQNPFPTETDCI